MFRHSFPSSLTSSPISPNRTPGAILRTLRCGRVPATSFGMSELAYPIALSPRGAPRELRNVAIASKRYEPTSELGMRAIDESDADVPLKMASASR